MKRLIISGQLFHEWAPGGLSYVAGLNGQFVLDAAIDRYHGQCAAASGFGSVHDVFSVGRKAGRFVFGGVGQALFLTIAQVEQEQLETPFATRNVGQQLAVGRYARADIVVALKRDALGFAAVGAHLVDLRAAAAVAGEEDLLAVGGELRFGIDAVGIGQAAQVLAIGVDAVDLGQAVAGQRQRQFLAIRRPRRG